VRVLRSLRRTNVWREGYGAVLYDH
jgi:hypothetical protein